MISISSRRAKHTSRTTFATVNPAATTSTTSPTPRRSPSADVIRSIQPTLADQLAIVCRHDDRRAAGVDLPEQIHDLQRQIGIEITGRLVGQHHHRVVDERACDRNTLLLAAGQLSRIRIRTMLEPDPPQHLRDLAIAWGPTGRAAAGTVRRRTPRVALGRRLTRLCPRNDAASAKPWRACTPYFGEHRTALPSDPW